MGKMLIIDSLFSYDRAGFIEDDELKEVVIEEKNTFQIGDIFIAKVKKILPSKFAFLDLGYDKNAFLGLTDKKQKNVYTFNEKTKKFTINLKQGQDILVQIEKKGTDIKGPSVTTNLTLTGKYIVLLLCEKSISISKKIDDLDKREFLKNYAKEILPENYGIIFRTNCLNTDICEIREEIVSLIEQAKNLLEKSNYIKSPNRLLFAKTEIEKIICDILKENDKIITNSIENYNYLKNKFINVELYTDNLPIFEAYSIESKIQKIFNNKIWLKSGGFLVIDYLEAMTVIDVNTGKNISKNLDDIIFKTNKEAIEQISKEIRLRNISGIILIDLIDMKNKEYKEELFQYMKQLVKKDRMPINVYPINELFIMQLTRKKTTKPLYEIISKPCFMCDGTGRTQNEIYIANTIKNKIISIFSNTIYNKVIVYANNSVIKCLEDIKTFDFKGKEIEFNAIYNSRFDYFKIEKIID